MKLSCTKVFLPNKRKYKKSLNPEVKTLKIFELCCNNLGFVR